MAILTPTTKLEAVNVLLSTIGESPVQTLSTSAHVHVSVAESTLDEVSRSVQSFGWHWNTDEDYPLALAGDGRIPVPANTLDVDSSGDYAHLDVAQRGQYLYDRTNHTYIFTTGITVDITFLLNWDELPEPARRYVTMRSARMFQNRVLGSEVLNRFTSQDEYQALAQLHHAESRMADRNILNNSSIMDIGRRY